jgi:hypothetical protein
VRRPHDRCVELLRASYNLVEIGHFAEPQQDAVTNLVIWVDEESVVVFDVSMVQLKDESVVGEQPFVIRATMITTEAEELLVPVARCFDVAYGDHRLGLSRTNLDYDADSVFGGIRDLYQPSLTAVELGAVADCPAAGLHLLERVVEAVGRDPQKRTAIRSWCDVGGQLADEARSFEASAAWVNRPIEHCLVEGS